ncbi:MAG: polysaccharide biosynthesis/export family protein [Candidatus Velthaea sp.]
MRRLLSFIFVILLSIANAPAFAADDTYKLHGGDELNIVVYGEKDLSQNVKILPSGTISYPFLGEVRLAGQTPTQAALTLSTGLSKYLRHPQVTVVVAKEGPINVLVLGNVKTPGKYELAARSHLTDALASAGGLGLTDGALPAARIANDKGQVSQASLQALLHDGDTTQNVALGDETTVYIPSPLTLNVQVLGAVDHPGDVTVREGDRLSMALARAGNSTNSNADLNHVSVRRQADDGTVQTYNVNLYDVLKKGDLSKDLVLKKNDLVYVPATGGRNQNFSIGTSLLYGLRTLIGL